MKVKSCICTWLGPFLHEWLPCFKFSSGNAPQISVGFRSGEFVGQSSTVIQWLLNHVEPTPAGDIDPPRHHRLGKRNTRFYASPFSCISSLPLEAGTFVAKWDAKLAVIRKEDLGPLGEQSMLFSRPARAPFGVACSWGAAWQQAFDI